MGQAKNRGTRLERVKQATARLEALRPDKLTCNSCKTDFTDFQMLDTRGMSGLDLACVGHCPECGDVTWGLKGDPAICQAFVEQMMNDHDGELNLGVQKLKS